MDLAPLPDGSPPVEVIAGLGAGGYACVCLVKPIFRPPGRADSELLAMKVVGKKIGARPKDRERLVTELKVLRDAAPSRFLQRCHGAFESSADVFFLCDYLAGGDLFFHMVRRFKEGRGAFSEPEARNVLAEVSVGLVHLHDRGFIHRDLKVENIMLDASGHVKLIDFGLSVELDRGRAEQPMSPSGSLAYMPPELVRSERKAGGRHTDWWAFGVVTYELLTGRTPWSSLSDKPLIRQEIQFAEVQYPPSLSPEARTFLETLLERDFRRRLGTAHDHEVLLSPFFQTVVWSAIERGESAPPVHLDVIGPDVVNPVDGRNAMAAYLKKVELSGSSEFGMASSFYLGEDFVTAYPAVTGLTKLRAATGTGP